MIRTLACLLAVLICLSAAGTAYASEGGEPLPDISWTFDGPTGTYDRAALQRGYKIYREVCSSCHSMKLLYYRNLEALGYNEAQIKNIAKEYTYIDGPNDEGDMFERPGLPSDPFKSPYENDKQGAAANNNALPPDLSLMAKARVGGPDYIFALLTGYEEHPPEGHPRGICCDPEDNLLDRSRPSSCFGRSPDAGARMAENRSCGFL